MSKKLFKGESPVVNKEALRRVVQGDVSGLMSGMFWGATPQGFYNGRHRSHWGDIYNGDKKLSKRSRRYINALLNL